MIRWFRPLFGILFALLAAHPSQSAVVYHIQQISFGTLSFDGMLTQPDHVQSSVTEPISSLDVVNNLAGFTSVSLRRNVVNVEEGFGFSVCSRTGQSSPCDLILLDNETGYSDIFLPLNALGSDGSYNVGVGLFSFAVAITSAVPELPSSALAVAGLVGLSWVRRRGTVAPASVRSKP